MAEGTAEVGLRTTTVDRTQLTLPFLFLLVMDSLA